MNANHVACEVKNLIFIFGFDEYISLQSIISDLISVCLIFSPSLLLYFLCIFFSLLSFFCSFFPFPLIFVFYCLCFMKAQLEVSIQIRLLPVILRILDLIFGGGKRFLFSTASKLALGPVSVLFRDNHRVISS
jgi:hypothetical protein